MKRIILSVLLVFSFLCLCACLSQNTDESTDIPDTTVAEEELSDSVTITGTVVRKDSALTVCDTPSGLLSVGINSADFTDESGNTITFDDISVGDKITITYDGMMLETYPGQITASAIAVNETGEPIFDLYTEAIRTIMDEDTALNGNEIALDVSKTSLTDGEKEALVWFLIPEYNSVFLSNLEQLQDDGKVKDLFYEDGCLITIEETDKGTFNISKWRSGTGAIGHTTKANYKNGAWQTKDSAWWIS